VHSGKFTIARIAVIATIAVERFPYEHNDRQWVATIAEIELESMSTSAIVGAMVAVIPTIAEERFPYDRNDR